jgi:hypothetical protein
MTIQTVLPTFAVSHSSRLAKCDTGEPLRKVHFVILSAAKNLAIFGFYDPFLGILHSADSVQNDNLLRAEVTSQGAAGEASSPRNQVRTVGLLSPKNQVKTVGPLERAL